MKILQTDIKRISAHKYLRLDIKYWLTKKVCTFHRKELLKEKFFIVNGSVQTKWYSLEQTSIPYVRIGDLDYKFGINSDEIIYLSEDCEIPQEKILQETDLVLATIGATVGKVGIAQTVSGGTFSNNTVVLRLKDNPEQARFYEKLFQTTYYSKYIFGVVSQKAQPNLQQYDLENIEIPYLSLETQNRIIILIEPIEKQISEIKETIKPIKTIIDDVFAREFNFDIDTFKVLKTQRKFTASATMFANNPDLRFSAKFHRDAGNFVMSQLCAITDKKIKHFLAEPIVLGASVSPNDFDENGDTYYVSMATIKTLKIELDDSQLLSKEYCSQKQSKLLKKGDIVLARSGVAIGKVALVEDDVDGIFADFTMRIRFDNTKYNSQFAYYYFRTTYFQYLIECYKKGLQNQNIFPIVVQEFPLPNISLEEQQRIVDEIQAEIDKQNAIKAQIIDLRAQIDKIIEDAVIQ